MKHYEKALYFIAGHRRGWAFSSSDLSSVFTRGEADDNLKYLTEKGKIRRISRGLYDYPKYSDLLKQELSPDIDQVARAFARKFNWRIEISGDSALNLLGLSTQIVAKHIYLSDGPNRSYDIMGTTLEFKKSALKEIGFKHKESSLIVQALKALGKDRITPKVIDKIKKQTDSKKYNKILIETKSTKIWIYEAIKQICRNN
ncbi:MAG: DUF6088 family protein [Candidatus Cloacimonadota bacterium]|nr:DUF6088 family protein [Candidatus Cloacimonadota bacterium]